MYISFKRYYFSIENADIKDKKEKLKRNNSMNVFMYIMFVCIYIYI